MRRCGATGVKYVAESERDVEDWVEYEELYHVQSSDELLVVNMKLYGAPLSI